MLRRSVAVLFSLLVAMVALGIPSCGSDEATTPVVPADASCTTCGTECVDLNTDPRHCGGCATKCDPGSTCVAAKCAVACPTGQVGCAGTCIDPKTSPKHCGASGACTGA